GGGTAEVCKEPYCGGQTDGRRDVRSTGLKAQGTPFELRRPVELDSVCHVAADVIRHHAVENVPTDPQRTGPHRPAELVARERVEVATKVLYIDRRVRRALCTIDKRSRTDGSGPLRDLLHGAEDAEHIGGMTDGDQPRACCKQILQCVETQLS